MKDITITITVACPDSWKLETQDEKDEAADKLIDLEEQLEEAIGNSPFILFPGGMTHDF